MKTFTTEEIIDLLNQVMRDEIDFSRMVGIINERVIEANEPQYKDGDFVVSKAGSTLIFRKKVGVYIYDHAYFIKKSGEIFLICSPTIAQIERYATEEEKQELLDALAKEGKRWNEEKLCIEDIPKRKFKKGDKVRIKHGVSSKTHCNIGPAFVEEMDDLIGKTMIVDRYTYMSDYVVCNEYGWSFLEEWLEPYEELKEGDLAIFWDVNKKYAAIKVYKQFLTDATFPHQDHMETRWKNAIKFESKEQYERFIKD